MPEFPELKQKSDFVLWCRMTKSQLKIYEDFLQSEDVKNALMIKASPLVQCTVLKKICDHPRRMSNSACQSVGLMVNNNRTLGEADANECAANSIQHISVERLISESGKLRAFKYLAEAILSTGEKLLVFSQSIKILDMIEKVLDEQDVRLIRMDGKDKSSVREEKVAQFQRDPQIKGGLHIHLIY